MSIEKMKRTVQKSQGTIEYNSKAADFISMVFFISLNLIAVLGEFTNILTRFGRGRDGILFLYETVCAPIAAFCSKFVPLSGTTIYSWVVAEVIFFATSIFVWLIIFLLSRVFRK